MRYYNGMLIAEWGVLQKFVRQQAARGPDTCQRKKERRMPAPRCRPRRPLAHPHSAPACVPHAAHEREASLLLEEEEEDGSYCFPLGQKASSDTNRRDVL